MSNRSLVRDFERKRKRSFYDVETVGGTDDDPHSLAADQRWPGKFDEPLPPPRIFNGSKTPAQKRWDVLFAASDKRGLFIREISDCKYSVSEKGGTRKVFLADVCYNDALTFIDSQPIQSPGH
jgi:hypothetical protein